MAETNPFKDISKRIKTIKIDGKDLRVKPKVKDAEVFVLLKKEMDEDHSKRISKSMISIIRRAYTPEELSDDDIETLVATHYGTLLSEVSILFGFTTREDLEKSKKDFTKNLKD